MSWLYAFVSVLFYALNLAILIRVILSWVNANPYSPLVSFIHQITDPILEPLRRVVPPIGMIDVTPLLAMILLSLLQQVLLTALGRALP